MKAYHIFLIFIVFSFSLNAKDMKIGTGSKQAIAYPVMTNICNIYHKYNPKSNISCKVVSTGGSQDNLEGIFSTKYQLGVMKSSMQYDAYHNKNIKNSSHIRTIFGLHTEYFTIIVKNNLNIDSFFELKNKRVNIPNHGSGSRLLYNKIMKKFHLNDNFFASTTEYNITKLKELFCNDKIDAAIYFIGHPNEAFANVMNNCDVKLVSLPRKEIENYLDISEYYTYHYLPRNSYKRQTKPIQTFGSQLLLSGSTKVAEEDIYQFTKTVLTHFDEIKKESPILNGSNPLDVFRIGGVAPIHKGAIKFYQERILLSLP